MKISILLNTTTQIHECGSIATKKAIDISEETTIKELVEKTLSYNHTPVLGHDSIRIWKYIDSLEIRAMEEIEETTNDG
jgi:hypothetical protein